MYLAYRHMGNAHNRNARSRYQEAGVVKAIPPDIPNFGAVKKKAVMIDIKVPTVGESISEVTLVKWLKKDGDYVNRDELLCELESEKATFELNAEQAGTLKIVAQEGATLAIGDVACRIDETAQKPEGAAAPEAPAPTPPPVAAEGKIPVTVKATETPAAPSAQPAADVKATPVAQAIMADKKVTPTAVKGSGHRWPHTEGGRAGSPRTPSGQQAGRRRQPVARRPPGEDE